MKYDGFDGIWIPIGADYVLATNRRHVQGILRNVPNLVIGQEEKRRYEAHRRVNDESTGKEKPFQDPIRES